MSPVDEDLVEDYLDHALMRLVGLAPYRRRSEIRQELRDHLLSLMEDGKSVCEALYELGDPWDMGERLVLEWEEKAAVSSAAKFSRSSFALAVVLFGMPFAVILHLVEEARLLPGHVGYIPLADELFLVAPFVSGVVLGCARPARAARNAAAICVFLAGFCVFCGLTTGPREDLLSLALQTLAVWSIPAAVCAHLSAMLCRRQRRRRFWRDLRMELIRPSHPASKTNGGTINEASLHPH